MGGTSGKKKVIKKKVTLKAKPKAKKTKSAKEVIDALRRRVLGV